MDQQIPIQRNTIQNDVRSDSIDKTNSDSSPICKFQRDINPNQQPKQSNTNLTDIQNTIQPNKLNFDLKPSLQHQVHSHLPKYQSYYSSPLPKNILTQRTVIQTHVQISENNNNSLKLEKQTKLSTSRLNLTTNPKIYESPDRKTFYSTTYKITQNLNQTYRPISTLASPYSVIDTQISKYDALKGNKSVNQYPTQLYKRIQRTPQNNLTVLESQQAHHTNPFYMSPYPVNRPLTTYQYQPNTTIKQIQRPLTSLYQEKYYNPQKTNLYDQVESIIQKGDQSVEISEIKRPYFERKYGEKRMLRKLGPEQDPLVIMKTDWCIVVLLWLVLLALLGLGIFQLRESFKQGNISRQELSEFKQLEKPIILQPIQIGRQNKTVIESDKSKIDKEVDKFNDISSLNQSSQITPIESRQEIAITKPISEEQISRQTTQTVTEQQVYKEKINQPLPEEETQLYLIEPQVREYQQVSKVSQTVESQQQKDIEYSNQQQIQYEPQLIQPLKQQSLQQQSKQSQQLPISYQESNREFYPQLQKESYVTVEQITPKSYISSQSKIDNVIPVTKQEQSNIIPVITQLNPSQIQQVKQFPTTSQIVQQLPSTFITQSQTIQQFTPIQTGYSYLVEQNIPFQLKSVQPQVQSFTQPSQKLVQPLYISVIQPQSIPITKVQTVPVRQEYVNYVFQPQQLITSQQQPSIMPQQQIKISQQNKIYLQQQIKPQQLKSQIKLQQQKQNVQQTQQIQQLQPQQIKPQIQPITTVQNIQPITTVQNIQPQMISEQQTLQQYQLYPQQLITQQQQSKQPFQQYTSQQTILPSTIQQTQTLQPQTVQQTYITTPQSIQPQSYPSQISLSNQQKYIQTKTSTQISQQTPQSSILPVKDQITPIEAQILPLENQILSQITTTQPIESQITLQPTTISEKISQQSIPTIQQLPSQIISMQSPPYSFTYPQNVITTKFITKQTIIQTIPNQNPTIIQKGYDWQSLQKNTNNFYTHPTPKSQPITQPNHLSKKNLKTQPY